MARTDRTQPLWIVGAAIGAALCIAVAGGAHAETAPEAGAPATRVTTLKSAPKAEVATTTTKTATTTGVAPTTKPTVATRVLTPTKPATTVATTKVATTTTTKVYPRPKAPPVMAVSNVAALRAAQATPAVKPTAIATKPAATATTLATKTPAKDPRFADVKSVGTTGRAVTSPGYNMNVSAARTAPKVATPVAAKTTPTATTFSERMARTTVTPPVMANGPKASNVRPAPVSPAMKAAPIPATVAVVKPSAPKSPPPGAKQAWHFREVLASSSSTAKIKGAVALGTVKPTASYAQPAPVTTIATKPTAMTTIATKPAATTKTVTSTTVAAKPAVTKAGPATAFASVQSGSSTSKAVLKAPAKAIAPKASATKVAANSASNAPLTTSVSKLGARFMEQREQYVYNSLNRRDPFASLVSGSFEGEVGTPLLDVSSMKLVGIVWGSSDKFALVEDGHGHGFVLRVGDPVLNGYIAGLTKEELIVKQSSYGDTQTVTIQLQRKEGASNAN